MIRNPKRGDWLFLFVVGAVIGYGLGALQGKWERRRRRP